MPAQIVLLLTQRPWICKTGANCAGNRHSWSLKIWTQSSYNISISGVFVSVKNSDCLVGACIAWFDEQNGAPVSSLHWLITKEAYQGRGIGSTLIVTALSIYEKENAFPVYLHTQPWSYQAVRLYHKFGFRLMKQESFSGYENQYALAVPVLARYIAPECMRELIERSE